MILSSIHLANQAVVEEHYQKFLRDASSVLPCWRDLFQQDGAPASAVSSEPNQATGDLRIYDLIHGYRTHGHLFAQFNPLAIHPPEEPPQLMLKAFGFHESDLSSMVPTCGLLPQSRAPLSDVIRVLKEIYCNRIGIEYLGESSPEVDLWLQQRIEPTRCRANLSIEQKRAILQQLNRSELFELFLHKNYTGQKRFSIEGGETLIPILNALVEQSAESGCKEFVLGMAHRGRLNVLCNILGKSYSEIFSEFEEGHIPDSFEGSGDVKYHKGFASEIVTSRGNKVRVVLAPNPSHLESVYPVVEGQVRAKQVKTGDGEPKDRVLPIVVHGDAALAGQGIVYETMQMYNLPGYGNGGTVHIVINNQIGFTTLPKDSRSTLYCTDIDRSFGAPVFHVNAEDPEGCIYATNLALELRNRFHCDVFIDLVCYRKFGHNETDEPAFTQPLEYQLIKKKKPIREIYRAQLIQQGILEREVAEALEADFERALHEARAVGKETIKAYATKSEKTVKADLFAESSTGVELETLRTIADRFCSIPDGFNLHPKLQHLLKSRLEMVHASAPVDWGMAEHLALGSLLWEGCHVRLSGQDTRRGTFSHRHAMWIDQTDARKYFPLSKLKSGQGRFDVFNSLLSEYATLAFEFGYSVSYPEALVLWEAQFGDFCNGGQVIIDQYIATAEQKWALRFGLVLLLPHGYEGQGPEHSSARIERFLTLCGDDNMCVVYPTTPAQMFHLLRRQMVRSLLKPLIVFTPKGLLRYPACVSPLQDLSTGSFQPILDDSNRPQNPKRLVLCTGRIYYDLIAEREKRKVDDLAIVRVEQLYPLHVARLTEILTSYQDVSQIYWVQEEPSNMGAWTFMEPALKALIGHPVTYIGRDRSASPAAGSYARHLKEHQAILTALFTS